MKKKKSACSGRGRPMKKATLDKAWEAVQRAELRVKNATNRYEYLVDMYSRCHKDK